MIKKWAGLLYEYTLMALLGLGAVAVYGAQAAAGAVRRVPWFKLFVGAAVLSFVYSFQTTGPHRMPSFLDPAEMVREKGPSVFVLTPTDNPDSGGTGFLIEAPSGAAYTITNAHVCRASTNGKMHAIIPERPDKHVTVAILDVSEDTDLCILTPVVATGRKPMRVAEAFEELNTNVYAIGHPYLKPNTFTSGITQGAQTIQVLDHIMTNSGPESKCEGKRYSVKEVFSFFRGMVKLCIVTTDAIETSLIIHPGNSGSPVFNLAGEVVGVAFASDNTDHHGFYIPLADLQEFLSVY